MHLVGAQQAGELGRAGRRRHRQQRRAADQRRRHRRLGRKAEPGGRREIPGRQLDHLPFGGRKDVGPAIARMLGADRLDELVDRRIVAQRIVVGECELPHPRRPGHRHRVFDRAVAPADLHRVFAGEILRVMHHEVGAGEELGVAAILPGDVAVAGREAARMRLVIAGINHRDAVGLDAIAQGERRVVEIARGHLDVVDPQPSLDQLMIADRRAELLDAHWKIGVLHLAGERVAQCLAEAARRVDVPFMPGLEQRPEERDALDVVPVGVADQDMAAQLSAAGHQLVSENRGARPHVEHDQRARGRPQLDTGRIPAIAQGPWTRCGDRSARPEEAHLHRTLLRTPESSAVPSQWRF